MGTALTLVHAKCLLPELRSAVKKLAALSLVHAECQTPIAIC